MKKSNASKALAAKKARADERKEGKLKGAAYKRHEKGEAGGYEGAEHRMPNGRMMKGKMHD